MISFLRNLIFEDFWLKLFSLVLAVLVWLTVSFAIRKETSPMSALNFAAPERTTFANLPVLVMSSAEDVRSFRVVPDQVSVTVQGEPRVLQNLQTKDIRALVDLTGLMGGGDVTKRIEISTPPGVTHVQVVPPEVKVIFPSKIAVQHQTP